MAGGRSSDGLKSICVNYFAPPLFLRDGGRSFGIQPSWSEEEMTSPQMTRGQGKQSSEPPIEYFK